MSSPAVPESPGFFRSLPSFLFGTFTRNLPAKIAALVLAILVWYTVRLDLTAKETFQAAVMVDVADGLMLTGPWPTHVQVELEGPTSQIGVLRQQDRVEIRLRVGLDDLAGQLTAQPRFSPDRGNVGHGYGTDIRIIRMVPSEIELSVAVRARAEVEVLRPRVELTSPEWGAELYLVATKVWLTGPKAVLDQTGSFTPPPISADEIVARVDEETYGPIERPLQLPASLKDQGVALAPGQDQEFRYRATFVRSRAPKTFEVPFAVYYGQPDTSLALAVDGSGQLRKGPEGFFLTIEFRGTPSNLALLTEAIDAGRVRAYVLAEEFTPFAKKEVGASDTASAIHLDLPEELWVRVSPTPPNPRDIILRVEAK